MSRRLYRGVAGCTALQDLYLRCAPLCDAMREARGVGSGTKGGVRGGSGRSASVRKGQEGAAVRVG